MSIPDELTITASRIGAQISFPDEFSLKDITLITPTQNVNIKALMTEMSIFEDIFRGAITGHVLIADSISLIDKLGLTGNEFLKLDFRKSLLSGDDKAYIKTFRIIRVSERDRINHNTEMYSLHFCSEDFFLSEQIKISKSYKGKTISEMVYDILKNELKINKKAIIEPSMGLYDFIIPYKNPFEAVNWLSNYALSNKYKGADFLFFENNKGFHFRPLQDLYSQSVTRDYLYSPKGRESLSKITEMENLLSNIKSYRFIDTFDMLYGTKKGVFANRLLTIDPMTRTFRDTVFSYSGKESKKLNDGNLINNYKNRLGLQANECFDAVYKVMVSNTEQKRAKGLEDKTYAVANDIRAETYVPYRTSQLSASNYSRLQIVISGDPTLSVGDLVKVELPSNNNENGVTETDGSKDNLHSGNYLVTAIRHLIDPNMKYETIVELAKDSYGMSPQKYVSTANKEIGKQT